VTDPILFHNPEGISTGGYGDRSDADERLWAAVEMAVTFGDEEYRKAAGEAIRKTDRCHAPFGWGDMRGYAALSGMQLNGEIAGICRQWVLDAADSALMRINPYGITMTERLPWGSNMNISNDGMVFYQAWLLTGDGKYRVAAEKQLHYLLGVNPVDYCYVSCFGSNPMLHPHHRPSVAQGVCQPGMLSGGAASGMMDPCAREYLQDHPAGKSFIDRYESYSTNEICVYWNSPMVALLAGLSK
jgi:endoglucanase